jgi:hypothetical protein
MYGIDQNHADFHADPQALYSSDLRRLRAHDRLRRLDSPQDGVSSPRGAWAVTVFPLLLPRRQDLSLFDCLLSAIPTCQEAHQGAGVSGVWVKISGYTQKRHILLERLPPMGTSERRRVGPSEAPGKVECHFSPSNFVRTDRAKAAPPRTRSRKFFSRAWSSLPQGPSLGSTFVDPLEG